MTESGDRERIVISSDDLGPDAPPTPAGPTGRSLPPLAPGPRLTRPERPSPLAVLGRNTLVSGLVAGLVGGTLGMGLAETIGRASSEDGAVRGADGGAEDGAFYNGIRLGTGDVQFTLTWGSTADLDLHVVDPDGDEIFYADRTSSSGGELDVDSNGGCGQVSSTPVENVFWPEGESPEGTYDVVVAYYAECDGGTGPQEFELVARVDGEVVDEVSGILDGPDDQETVLELDR